MIGFRSVVVLAILGTFSLMVAQESSGGDQENRQAIWEKGKDCLQKGSYEMAQELLEKVTSQASNDLGLRELVEVYRTTGQYEKAIQTAQRLYNGAEKFSGKILLGEIFMELGRYEDAKEAFLEAYRLNSEHVSVKANLAWYYFLRGQQEKCLSYWDKIFDNYDPDTEYTAEELTYIAKVCRHYAMNSNAVDRSDTLKEIVHKILPRAIQQDKYYFPAYQEMAEILADAFNWVDSKSVVEDALKLNPHHPGILVNQAYYCLQQFHLRSEVIPILQHVLRINPKNIEALNLQSAVYLSDEEYDKAEETLQKALAVNPNHFTTQSLQAAFYYMRGRRTAYEAECQKILALNPHYGRLYFTVASMVIYKRLFADAVMLNRKAIELDPLLWHAYIDLGVNLMRLGDEKEAEKYLGKVRDEYNFHTETHNTLLLLSKYNEFKCYEEPNFKIRLHVSEADVLHPFVSKTLQNAYQTLVKKYQFTPETPLLFEMFPDHRDFSVRTIGLESLGANGACFGKVVVEDSPKALPLGTMNWVSVAWHELTHVFTLQMTNYQIPRWFTEGLSELSEKERSRACDRRLDLELYSIFCSGRLRGIGDLNSGFTRPQYPQEIVICYYQAGLICEFLVEKFGFAKILEMLRLYRQEKKDSEVFSAVLGVDTAQFDHQFQEWLRMEVFSKMQVFPSINPRDIEELKDQIAENPKNLDAYIKLSLGYLQQGRFTDAEIYASQLLGLAPQNSSTYDILGYIAYQQRNVRPAKNLLEKAVQLGSQNFYTHLVLGLIYWHQGKNAEKAIESLEKAKISYPGYVRPDNPYLKLAEIYLAKGEKDKAFLELESYLGREGQDFNTRLKLAKQYLPLQRYEKALRLLEEACEIYPLDVEIHDVKAQTHKALQQWQQALSSYEIALIVSPANTKHRLYSDMAEVCIELKQFERAKVCAEKALGLNANDQRAKELLEKLPK